MVKTIIILALALLLVYAGLDFYAGDEIGGRTEIFAWTAIIFTFYLLEKGLQYLLKLPFKKYFADVRQHHLARMVQDSGIALSYVSFWLAVGFSPINGWVTGQGTEFAFSNPEFLKISLVLLTGTFIFSILWWVTLQFKK